MGQPTSPPVSRPWGSTSSESQASITSSKSSPSSPLQGEVRRLTDKELQDKRAKGLCYRCDAKWAVGHRCRKKELSVLSINEEDEVLEQEEKEDTAEVVTEVSLNSIIGFSNQKTMKLIGAIGDYELIVMVDPCATHNFISIEAVQSLGIPIEKSGGFGVSLGNGDAVRGEGICKGVCLKLEGGIEVISDFLPLGLGCLDVILGVQWLETLGVVMTDWKKQVMMYEFQGEPVMLKGDPTLIRSQISLKAMVRALKKTGEGGYWVEWKQQWRKAQRRTQMCHHFWLPPLSSTPKSLRNPLVCHPKGLMNMPLC